MNQSPFKLLEAYGAGDKDIFFGRDSEVYALYNLLQQTQLALVYGASGTGKTSLINAGLPRVFKMADWFKVAVRRRDNINDALCAAIGSYLGTKPTPSELPDAVRQVFERRWIPVYLVFDQFEELFTLGQDEEERLLFFRTLRDILAQNTAVKVVLTMREEYIGHLYDYEHILPNLFDKRFRVEAMKDDTICTVISRTCRVHGISLENGDDTARAILRRLKTGKQAVQLPYLQIYLHALYLKADETMPRVRFTDALVGLEEHSLERVLNRFIGGKMAEAQAYLQEKHPGIPASLAEAILDDFATEAGTKRALRVQDLMAKHSQPAQVIQDALRYFDEKARLLRADEDDVSRYEPVHDVVARQIHELRSAEDKEYKAFLRELETAHARWLQDGKPTERLLPEIDLLRVEGYAARLAQRQEYQMGWADFVAQSRGHIAAVKRRKRVLNMVLVVVTVLAVLAAGVAVVFWQDANRQKQDLAEANIEIEAQRKAAEDAKQIALDRQAEAEAARDSISAVYQRFVDEQLRREQAELAQAIAREKADLAEIFTRLDRLPKGEIQRGINELQGYLSRNTYPNSRNEINRKIRELKSKQ